MDDKRGWYCSLGFFHSLTDDLARLEEALEQLDQHETATEPPAE